MGHSVAYVLLPILHIIMRRDFHMRAVRVLLFTAIAFFSYDAHADHFSCDLTLNLIPDSESSELKHMVFDIDLSQNPPVTTGTLITTSCWGTFTDPFRSTTTQFKKFLRGDLIQGSVRDLNLTIADHHYQLLLKFSQLVKDPADQNEIDFMSSGRIVPSDNDLFIHQVVQGPCKLTKEQTYE